MQNYKRYNSFSGLDNIGNMAAILILYDGHVKFSISHFMQF